MTLINKRSFDEACCCGNPAGLYPDDCERCELIARIKHLETLLQRLRQSMQTITVWSEVALLASWTIPREATREWLLEELANICAESQRVLKACKKQETGHD